MDNRGFSLLELIIVMVLISMIMMLIYPVISKQIRGSREQVLLKDMMSQIESLKWKAFSQKRLGSITLQQGNLIFSLGHDVVARIAADGFELKMQGDIFFNQNGLTSGGIIKLYKSPGSKEYRILVREILGEMDLVK